MEIYRIVWGATVISLSTLGGTDVVVHGGGVGLLGTTGLVAAFFAATAFGLAEGNPRRWWWVRRSLLWGALGTASFYGLAGAWSAGGVAVGSALLVTYPGLGRGARHRWFAWTMRNTPGVPESMGRRDLLRRWELTTLLLRQRSGSPSGVLALVDERRRLLDELERRDASAFVAWLPAAVPDRPPPSYRSRLR